MGLFKRLVNYVTGGSAHVDVDIENAQLSTPFKVQIAAEIGNMDIDMDNVYLNIRCTEGKLVGFVEEDKIVTDNERILQELNEWNIDTIYKKKVEVTGAGVLKAGENYSWEVEVDLSDAEKKTFKSAGYEIRWQLQAAIDVTGNDPDSGWVHFDVT